MPGRRIGKRAARRIDTNTLSRMAKNTAAEPRSLARPDSSLRSLPIRSTTVSMAELTSSTTITASQRNGIRRAVRAIIAIVASTTIRNGRLPDETNTTPTNDPLWYKDAVIYQTHVKAFRDSTEDGFGDFKGLTEKLDYIPSLGVTAIWLLPFYPSPLKDDGYDISMYEAINPTYGTIDDFRGFLDEALALVVEGTTPFRLERRIGDLAYPAGDVELLDDEPGTDDAALERAIASITCALRRLPSAYCCAAMELRPAADSGGSHRFGGVEPCRLPACDTAG